MSTDVIDLSARDFWHASTAEREQRFATLRREQPISFQRPPDSELTLAGLGSPYWAVVRHRDVTHVSRHPELFGSSRGVSFEDVAPEIAEQFQSFLVMDAPRHTKLRGLVRAAFTPRQVKRIEEAIHDRARRIVDELIERSDCDFVEHVSARLPTLTIWDMWGVPEQQHGPLTAAADQAVGWNDPEIRAGREPAQVMLEAAVALRNAATELAAQRRSEPGDDLMSGLIAAEVDGERLTDDEICGFFILLAVAGNDTTRHTTTHALHALTAFPDQRGLLLDDLPGRIDGAIEECLRWATPVLTFSRTAMEDTELAGKRIAAGDKVTLFYLSANRDEQVFEQPERFQVLRTPNKHVAFGGGGPHFCLGASLARTQLRALFTELLTRLPTIAAGEPEPLVGSNFINGVKRMPCRLHA